MAQSRSETPSEEEHPAVPPLSELEKEWGKPPVTTGEDLGITIKEEEGEEPKPKPKPRKKIKRKVKRKVKKKPGKKAKRKRPKKRVRKVGKKSRKS